MSNFAKIEKEVMNLAPEERELLVLSAWESLGNGADVSINELLDPEGIRIANERDRELSSGSIKPISHAEFLRRIKNFGGP